MNERRWVTPLLLSVVVALSMLVGGLVATRSSARPVASVLAASEDTSTSRPISAVALTGGIADIIDRATKSTVLISGSSANGSGLVVDKLGHIVTNYHVVEGQTTLKVTLSDGSASLAKILGTDPGTDLAVIKAAFTSDKLVPANLGDSDLMRPGDAVFAIGSPFDQPFTVTSGIVSAIGRTTQSSFTGRSIRDVLQIDAAVNPGNSGGPLFNLDGETVGINSSIENPIGRFFVGLGFAIPSNTVKRLLPKLIAGEDVLHPQLGVSVIALDAVVASDLGVSAERGVYVTVVQPGSAAARAGLVASGATLRGTRVPPKGGDVITSINGRPVVNFSDLARAIDSADVGSTVRIVVERNGQPMTLTATLQPWDLSAR